jgi:hypothetical protein
LINKYRDAKSAAEAHFKKVEAQNPPATDDIKNQAEIDKN